MVHLICETCGEPATARSATSYACDRAECRGYDAASGFQTWEPFVPECGICAEVGDPIARATWKRDDPGIRFACDECKRHSDEFARSIGEDGGGWAPILPPGIVRTEYPDGSSEVHAAGCGSGSCCGGCVPAPILASLVNAPVTRLNGGGL